MTKLNCPSCGGEVPFQSRQSVFAVCPYCQSMLVRRDVNIEAIGKMAELPADISPLQIGSCGRFQRASFQVLGRVKIGWSDGGWNEWFVSFDDGKEGWLAEAQGDYMINFAAPEAKALPAKNELRVGASYNLLPGKKFTVQDIKEVTCVGGEGELPFQAPKGRRSTSVDLTEGKQGFASLDYSPEGTQLYLGEYVTLDGLEMTNLRALDGW